MNAPRLGIGIIGAGRVGAVLGAALRAQGHAIVGAYAVSDASRDRAAELLPGVPLCDVPTIVERAEMLLLAVPDDELPGLARGIAASGIVPGGQLVVHTSGAHGTDVLAPLARAGSATIALHPAMTFTGTRADLPRLSGCPIGVTAAQEILPEGDRVAYHAALAHASNHLVVLVDQARDILARIGIENPGAYLQPLLTASLDNALAHGAAALTGPVSRGDAEVVRAHLDALTDLDATAVRAGSGDTTEVYRALARAALERAGLDPEQARAVRAVLDAPHEAVDPTEEEQP